MVRQRKNIAPCKDCTERAIGCHPKCSRYLEWKQKDELLRAEKRECGRAVADVIDYKKKAIAKCRIRRGDFRE